MIFKFHLILFILSFLSGIFVLNNKKEIFFILPSILVLFSSPFLLFVLFFMQRQKEKKKELEFKIYDENEYELFKSMEHKYNLNDETLFYIYKEKIIPENHALYYVKNLNKKNSMDSKILSSSAIMHKEEKLLKDINSAEIELKKRFNLKNLILLTNLYYDYLYYDYGTAKIKSAYIEKSIRFINKYITEREGVFPPLYSLMGKFSLLKMDYEEAEKWFSKLMNATQPDPVLISYLAEIYFYRGDFESMSNLINWLSFEKILNEKMREVVHFWKK